MRMSRRIAMNQVGRSHGRLPDDYYELKWLESDGGQYIDTGYSETYFRTGFDFCSHFKIDFSSRTSQYLCGCFAWAGRQYDCVQLSYDSDRQRARAMYPTTKDNGDSLDFPSSSVYALESNVLYDRFFIAVPYYEYGDATYTLNDTVLARETLPNTNPENVMDRLLLSINGTSGDNPNYRAVGEFGEVKMYSYRYGDTTMIRDFVPAYRIADGAVGYVDILTNTWYGNAGTGSFVAGDFV